MSASAIWSRLASRHPDVLQTTWRHRLRCEDKDRSSWKNLLYYSCTRIDDHILRLVEITFLRESLTLHVERTRRAYSHEERHIFGAVPCSRRSSSAGMAKSLQRLCDDCERALSLARAKMLNICAVVRRIMSYPLPASAHYWLFRRLHTSCAALPFSDGNKAATIGWTRPGSSSRTCK